MVSLLPLKHKIIPARCGNVTLDPLVVSPALLYRQRGSCGSVVDASGQPPRTPFVGARLNAFLGAEERKGTPQRPLNYQLAATNLYSCLCLSLGGYRACHVVLPRRHAFTSGICLLCQQGNALGHQLTSIGGLSP